MCVSFTNAYQTLIYARCVEGRCPYFDILPLQGRRGLKTFE